MATLLLLALAGEGGRNGRAFWVLISLRTFLELPVSQTSAMNSFPENENETEQKGKQSIYQFDSIKFIVSTKFNLNALFLPEDPLVTSRHSEPI